MAGAFDLSSLKKSSSQSPGQKPGAAGGAPAPGGASAPGGAAAPGEKVPGPLVVDVDAKSLQSFMQMSMSVPVVVAFHSPSSPNSQQLVTKLEELVKEYGGQFQLGKVNVDTSSDVAGAFGVNAVPAAAALLQGNPVPLFQGLPDDAQIRQMIDTVIKAAHEYGITGVLDGDEGAVAPEPEVPPLHKEGLEALEKGDLDGAHAAYSKALSENPKDAEAKTALAQVELLQRVQALNPLQTQDAIQSTLDKANAAELTDVDAQLMGADIEIAYNRPDAALARLLDVVKATSGDDREKARQRILDYFEILGSQSELVIEARKKLSSALF